MSYSFTKRAATRSALLALVCRELDVIAKQQPLHEHDFDQILSNFANAASLVAPDKDRPYSGHMLQAALNGYVSWRSRKHEGIEEPEIVGVNISCSVSWCQMTQAELADEAATRVSDPSVYGSGEGANPQVGNPPYGQEEGSAYTPPINTQMSAMEAAITRSGPAHQPRDEGPCGITNCDASCDNHKGCSGLTDTGTGLGTD